MPPRNGAVGALLSSCVLCVALLLSTAPYATQAASTPPLYPSPSHTHTTVVGSLATHTQHAEPREGAGLCFWGVFGFTFLVCIPKGVVPSPSPSPKEGGGRGTPFDRSSSDRAQTGPSPRRSTPHPHTALFAAMYQPREHFLSQLLAKVIPPSLNHRPPTTKQAARISAPRWGSAG